MSEATRINPARIVLSPHGSLVAGGSAEAFEQQLQQLLRAGGHRVIVDLSAVDAIDSSGFRALVRGHTTAQRLGGTMRLAAVSRRVRDVLDAAHLGQVFEFYASVDAARMAAWPWKPIAVGVGGALLSMGLLWLGLRWPGIGSAGDGSVAAILSDRSGATAFQPFVEVGKLIAAALIGLLVTAVHKPTSRDRLAARSMAQAQMLLCVSGALMMIIIGNSLPRAFGIAGAASIIRFRTPVDDPKDVTILFILMGLGMAAGLGALAVAGLATAFLCITLVLLDALDRQQLRLMAVEITADGRTFPSKHVEEVFARNDIVFEPREVEHGDEITVKYHTWLDPRASIEELSAQMRGIPGVSAVGWEPPKRA